MPLDGNVIKYETDERTRILRDWVHELRHGGHRQICDVLHNAEGHCALGVLDDHVAGGHELLLRSHPNDTIWRVADINDGNNGHRRHTFSEIADYIESEWL